MAYYRAQVINKSAPQLSHNLPISSGVIFNNPKQKNNNNDNMFFSNRLAVPQVYIPNQIHMSLEGSLPRIDPQILYNPNLAPPSIQVPNNDSVYILNINLHD